MPTVLPLPEDVTPHKRTSLVSRLTVVYIALGFINIVFFWLGTGTNQMRLIAEKSTLETQFTAQKIIDLMQAQAAKSPRRNLAQFPKLSSTEAKDAVAPFQKLSGDQTERLLKNRLISVEGKMLFSSENQGDAISSQDFQNVLKAVQLFEVRQQRYLAIPNLTHSRIDIFFPLGDSGIVFEVLVAMTSVEKELKSLLLLALFMVALLLLIQSILGYIIYRIVILPLRKMSDASQLLKEGKYEQIQFDRKHKDEIFVLLSNFNDMSAEIKKRTDIITANYAALKKHQDKTSFELDIAKRIQTAILPAQLKAGNLEIAAYYLPLHVVSGDFYDVRQMPDGSVLVFLADASGHGVPAAFITIMAKVYFSSLAEAFDEPHEILIRMNKLLYQMLEGQGLYMTAFLMRLYPDNRIVYANCSHPEPIIIQAGGTEVSLASTSATMIGIFEDLGADLQSSRMQLYRGDRLVLYTDGLSEAKSPEAKMYGPERIQEKTLTMAGKNAAETLNYLVQDIAEFSSGTKADDDCTLLVIDVVSGPEAETPLPMLAEAAYQATNYEKALAYYEQLPHLAPLAQLQKADCLLRLDRYAEAEVHFREFLTLKPNVEIAYQRLAAALTKQEKTKDAHTLLLQALAKFPQSIKLQTLQKNLEMDAQKWQPKKSA